MARLSLGRTFCLIALVALALPATAYAKLSLHFDRTPAGPGDRVSLTFGEYFTSKRDVVHVYLVHAPTLAMSSDPQRGAG